MAINAGIQKQPELLSTVDDQYSLNEKNGGPEYVPLIYCNMNSSTIRAQDIIIIAN